VSCRIDPRTNAKRDVDKWRAESAIERKDGKQTSNPQPARTGIPTNNGRTPHTQHNTTQRRVFGGERESADADLIGQLIAWWGLDSSKRIIPGVG